MLRVLTLSTLFPQPDRPGFGVFVGHQTRHLAAHPDVDLTVVSPVGLPPAPFDRIGHYGALRSLPLTENWEGITVHRPRFPVLPMVGTRFTPRFMTQAILPLVSALHRDRPFDVIDAQFFWPDGPVAMKIGAALDLPYSVKARGADIHHWGRQTTSAIQVIKAGQQADGLLAVSNALKTDMVALGMPGEKIRVHYTGVDLQQFRLTGRFQAKQLLGIGGPLIVTIGALIPRKRQGLVIDALARLPHGTLALIGQGPDAVTLQNRVIANGLADRVRFLGALPQADVAQWLSAADVMCLPSASEGLANAWVEALACGTPIVITDVGGARELVGRTQAGRIVAAEPASLAAAIQALIYNPPDRAAVRATVKHFTWEANRDALFAHLSSIARRDPFGIAD